MFSQKYIDCTLVDQSPGKFTFSVSLPTQICVQLILKYETKYRESHTFNSVKIMLNGEQKFYLDGIIAHELHSSNKKSFPFIPHDNLQEGVEAIIYVPLLADIGYKFGNEKDPFTIIVEVDCETPTLQAQTLQEQE